MEKNKFKNTKNALKNCWESYNIHISEKCAWKYREILCKEGIIDVSKIIEDIINNKKFNFRNVNYIQLKDYLKDIILSNSPDFNSDSNKLLNILNNNVDDNVVAKEINEINYEIFCEIINNYIDEILNLENPSKVDIIDLTTLAEYIAEKHLKSIASSKLRDFYNYILKIDTNDNKWFVEFALLKPKIAYHVGKETNKEKQLALKKLGYLVDSALMKIREIDDDNIKKDKFKNFRIFFESIIAYHKIYSK